MTSTNASARPLAIVLLLLLAASFIPTCSSTPKAPRNGWAEEWGPLVPHTKFPADCSLCHVPERWDLIREGFSFDHGAETGHVLEGAHREAACLRCHNDYGPVREFAARGCFGCHADIHQGRLGNECSRCHNQNNWFPGGLVAEHARTRFPLYGVHLAVACEQCHPRAPTGDFSGTPARCAFCHADDAARATSPDHVGQGWTTSCERCHVPTSWRGAGFIHASFPLTGAHAALGCQACHAGGDFGGLSRDCYSCHRDDYDAQPTHAANGFSTACQNCHNTSTWAGATFNHRFPIVGVHNVDCAQCHPGGSTSSFNCLLCHEHARTTTDNDHDEVSGYVYDSASCVRCHPTGRGD